MKKYNSTSAHNVLALLTSKVTKPTSILAIALALCVGTASAQTAPVDSVKTSPALVAVATVALAYYDAKATVATVKADASKSCLELKISAALGNKLSVVEMLNFAKNCNK
jgi:hypothetical protein